LGDFGPPVFHGNLRQERIYHHVHKEFTMTLAITHITPNWPYGAAPSQPIPQAELGWARVGWEVLSVVDPKEGEDSDDFDENDFDDDFDDDFEEEIEDDEFESADPFQLDE
jgi:hypothetical protein